MAKKATRAKRRPARKVEKRDNVRRPSKGLAIGALILNVIIPGLGSLVAWTGKSAIYQISLTVISLLLVLSGISAIILIGSLLYFLNWIWGIVTGIYLIRKAA